MCTLCCIEPLLPSWALLLPVAVAGFAQRPGKGLATLCSRRYRARLPLASRPHCGGRSGATRLTIAEALETQDGYIRMRVIATFDGESETERITPTETTTYVIECEGSTMYSSASLNVQQRQS
jgi:hypothetical protein